MALVTPGSLVGQISGRIGAVVYSHNKGGPYVRNGTIPVTSTTPDALAAKARLGGFATNWKNLTAGQRLAWQDWAAENPYINRLGQARPITGIAAYISLNTRLAAAGATAIADPPITPTPAPLSTFSAVVDIGSGGTSATFTPTPLAASERLWMEAAVTNSSGIRNVEAYKRFIGVSGAAQATGYDFETQLVARLGALVAGQYVTLFFRVFDEDSGLYSPPLRAETTVIDTP